MEENLWDWVVTEAEKGLQAYRKEGDLPSGQTSSWTLSTLAAARLVQAVEEFRKSSSDLANRLVLITLLLFVIGLCQGAFLIVALIAPYVTK
ncbi:MAG: hypothetical protein GTN49_09310 [candidate division Zixibacteria bacterium]|nr:hypothetical protein [candidate division Zixibacteria bacterium]